MPPSFRATVEEHAAAVREALGGLRDRPAQTLPLAQAAGRVVAEDVLAPVPLPLFTNSQMDGYAVRAADVATARVASPVVLPVVGTLPAGPLPPGPARTPAPSPASSPDRAPARAPHDLPRIDPPAPSEGRFGAGRVGAGRVGAGRFGADGGPGAGRGDRAAGGIAPLEPGTAVRVMTGAPLPPGADAVVPVEDTDGGVERVAIRRPRDAGAFVRERGSDAEAGDLLIPAGTVLAPHRLAVLASAGLREAPVRIRPRLAVISTGSELADPGSPLRPGKVYDANLVTLPAAAGRAGARVVLFGRVRDEPAQLAELLDAAVEAGAEAVITSGGVSMGAFEVVRELLEPRGARVGTVAMQPGGPQGLGSWAGVPVVCLPGNPVSALLSFELFVAPLLRELSGLPQARRRREPLAHDVSSTPGKRQYLRARRGEHGIELVGGQGSHLVAALAAAELLAIIPEEATLLRAGALVETVEL